MTDGETGEKPGIWRLFRSTWRPMLGIQLLFLALGLAITGPLAGFAIHRAVRLSGDAALSDAAIASFLLRPSGILLALALGAILITLQVLGYAAQLLAAHAALHQRPPDLPAILARSGASLPPLLRLALRFLARQTVIALPFLALVGAIYFVQLRNADINYYLEHRPPEFLLAAALAALLLATMTFFQIRAAVGWFHALPIVLIRRESPVAARRASVRAAHGSRHRIFLVIALWLAGTPLLVSLLNLPWPLLALYLAGLSGEYLGLLALALGLLLALSTLTALAVNFIALSLLAIYNIRLFHRSGLDPGIPSPARESARRLPFGFKTLLAASLAGLLAATFVSHRFIDRLGGPDRAVVIAHRGASAHAPENTLAAIELAIAAGADWIEIDVQESGDGEIIVAHDADFRRVAGNPLKVRDATRGQLDEIDAGSWFDPKFSGQRPPSLREALAACKDRAGLLIELKYYGHEKRLEQGVIDLVEEAGMSGAVMIMSLNYDGLRRFRELRPGWKLGLLSTVSVGNLTRLDVDFLGLNARVIKPDLLRRARAADTKVFAWTVNDPGPMSSLLSAGVDGIITDQPALARRVLHERSGLNPAERLLIDLAARFGKTPPQTAP